MKPTPRYTVEKLLLNESFLNFYFRKDETDVWEWEEFREDHPDQHGQISEAVQMLDRLSLKWNEAHIRQRLGQLQADLATLETPVRPLTVWRSTYSWAASIAALLVLVSGLWLYRANRATSPVYQSLTAKKHLIERVNTTDTTQLVVLPDGSSILLQKDSRLSYPPQFAANQRAVYLDGEAFFEVQKDSHRPFYVYANEVVTRVLGTSFTIDARPGNKAVRVVVRTGKVSVYRYDEARQQPGNKGVVVTPNQQLSLDRDTPEFTRSLVTEPQLLQQTKGFDFAYQDTPAAVVFAQIQQAYGVPIIYDESQMRACPVTAFLADEPLYEKLKLVCRAIEARYEVIDGQVVITGGCAN